MSGVLWQHSAGLFIVSFEKGPACGFDVIFVK